MNMYNIGLDEIREDENEFFETREQEIVRFLSSFEFSEDALNSIHEDTQIQTDLAVLGPDASKHEIRRILLHSQNESSETPYIYLWENSEMKTVFLNIHLGSSGSQSDLDKLGENDDLIALLKAYYVQEYYLIYGGDLNADVLQKDIQDAFLKLINATWYSDKLFDMSVGISDKTRGMSNQQILTKLFKQDYKAKDVILAFNPRLKERDPDRIMTLDYSGSFQRLAEDNGINITTSQAKRTRAWPMAHPDQAAVRCKGSECW